MRRRHERACDPRNAYLQVVIPRALRAEIRGEAIRREVLMDDVVQELIESRYGRAAGPESKPGKRRRQPATAR